MLTSAKNKLIKTLSILTAMAMLTAAAAGCTSTPEPAAQDPTPAPAETVQTPVENEDETDPGQTNDENERPETLNLGILQFVTHDALDAAREGFLDGLAEAGYIAGENLFVDTQNAQADQSNLKTMSQRLIENSDLILAIATPAAQSVAMETQEIPILITAVTDPAESDLVDSNERPGGNVTGTSDLTPVAKQFDLIQEILPDAQTVGIMYNSSESNSEIQRDLAVEASEKLGLSYEFGVISSVNDIAQAVEALAGNVDVIYIPTDNTLASAYPLIVSICNDKGIPMIVGEEAGVDEGALITDGIAYYNLGRQTADMALRIINGEAEPADMPIEYLSETTIVINQSNADLLGIEIPESIMAQVDRIVD